MMLFFLQLFLYVSQSKFFICEYTPVISKEDSSINIVYVKKQYDLKSSIIIYARFFYFLLQTYIKKTNTKKYYNIKCLTINGV